MLTFNDNNPSPRNIVSQKSPLSGAARLKLSACSWHVQVFTSESRHMAKKEHLVVIG